MHQNPRFNIMQSLNASPMAVRKFVVIDGQRLPSGAPAQGYKVVSAEMGRETAIVLADAVEAFATDLSRCCDMTDRKDSIRFLAEKVGVEVANDIAFTTFGLRDSYYRV